MKRILLVALAIIMVISLAACGDDSSSGGNIGNKKGKYDKDATENIDAGKVSMDEDVVKELLSAFTPDQTGLSNDVYDYVYVLSAVMLNGESACKAEAFAAGQKEAEGIFYIIGTTCYRYDKAQDKYYALKLDGNVEVKAEVQEIEEKESEKPKETTAPATTQKTVESINDDNNRVMQKRFANYDLSALNLPKPISEYEFLMTGKPVTTVDGTTAFVMYLLEDGKQTEYVFAFSSEQDYYYDYVSEEFKPLS